MNASSSFNPRAVTPATAVEVDESTFLPSDQTATFERTAPHTDPHAAIGIAGSDSSVAATMPSSDTIGVTPLAAAGPSSFELRAPIARGGMGEVWQAVQVALGRIVAVKRIRRDLLNGGDAAERATILSQFHQEAVVAAQLEHPNILPIHDFGSNEAGDPLLAMKLVNGRPWTESIAADWRALPVADFLAKHLPILIDVAQAVAFAHSRGIVHRDLKPAQVMVGEFGEVLLTDWGLALCIDDSRASADGVPAGWMPTRDTASAPCGTPALMAPEQTEWNAARVGVWTDLYLLGGTLYFLLTRTYPHESANAQLAFAAARNGMIQPPQERAPGREIPEELAHLALRCLQVLPEQRIGSALEFVAELQDYLSGARQRRESQAIALDVAVRLERAGGDYRECAECLSRLVQARALWGANPALGALEDRALGQLARGALENGDLVLARVQAERIEDASQRGPLLERILHAETAARRQAAQRRLAFAGIGGLLAVIGIGSTVFSINLAAARREAEAQRDEARGARAEALRQRDEARAARRGADGLVSFMLDDLRVRIAPLDPTLKPLDEVAHRAAAHYRRELLSPSIPQDESRLAFEGLLRTADIFLTQGNSEASSETLAAAAVIARSRADETPWWELQQSAVAVQQARHRRTRGDLPEALAIFEREMPRLLALAEEHSSDADFLGAAYKATGHAIDTMLTADAPGHRALVQEQRRLLQRIMEVAPNVDMGRELVISDVMAALANFDGGEEDSIELLENACAFADTLLLEKPNDTDVLMAAAWAWFQHASVLERMDAPPDRTLEVMTRAVRHYRRLIEIAPDSHEYRIGLGNGLNYIGSLLSELARFEEAEAAWLEGFEHLSLAAEKDDQNGRWRSTYAAAMTQYAKMLAGTDRLDDADMYAAKVVGIYEELIAQRPNHPTFHLIYINTLHLRGTISARRERHEEAAERFHEVIEKLDVAIAAFPQMSTLQMQAAMSYAAYADALVQLQRWDEAGAMIEATKLFLPDAVAAPREETTARHIPALHLAVVELQYRKETVSPQDAVAFSARTIADWRPIHDRWQDRLATGYAKLLLDSARVAATAGELERGWEWLEEGAVIALPEPDSLREDEGYAPFRADSERFAALLKSVERLREERRAARHERGGM